MVVRLSKKVFLGGTEIAIIHFIASRPELLSKIGYRIEYIQEHLNYGSTSVRNGVYDLIILGLCKRYEVRRADKIKGRTPSVYVFHYPLITQLSERYKKIEDFTTTIHERRVADLLSELVNRRFMSELQIIAASDDPTIPPIVKKYNQLIACKTESGKSIYTATELGKQYAQDLQQIQTLLHASTNLFISGK